MAKQSIPPARAQCSKDTACELAYKGVVIKQTMKIHSPQAKNHITCID